MLREAAPSLHLASADGLSASTLADAGITHVVNVTVDMPFPAGATFAEWRVPIANDIGTPLHEHLEGAAAFIDAGLGSGGRVCAFCTDGTSAAPAVIAFYLMRHRKLSLADALAAVATGLPSAQPNVGFWQRLVEAESWLHGCETPSVTLQEYKWQFLQRDDLQPTAGKSRADIMQQLELGQAEVAALLEVAEAQAARVNR